MTAGPASLLALVAAVWPAFGMFLFGFFLVLVMLAGPLIKLP